MNTGWQHLKNSTLTGLLLAGGLIVLGGCSATAVRHEGTSVKVGEGGLRVAETETKSEFEEIDRRAFQYYINGLLYEEIRELDSASESYRRAWSFCPSSKEIGLAYVRSLVQLKNFTRALEALNQLGADDPEVLMIKALCFRRLGDPFRAKQAYLDIVAIDSTSEMAYMFLASFYQRRNELDSAVWALKNFVRIVPNNHEVLVELGKAQAANQDWEGARDSFQRSLSLRPATRNMDALLRLGETFERTSQLDSARVVFEGVLELDPDNSILHREIARLWLSQDSARQALPHMRAVAELNPDDFLASRRLAIVMLSTDSLESADSILTDLVAVGDPDPANHFYLGRIGFMTEDFERARDELTVVTERASTLPDGWLGLGFAYRRLGQDDEEISTYKAGLLAMRDEAMAIQIYFALGAAFERTAQVDSAVAAFEEILEHNPDHAPSLNYLGYTLADRGIRLEYARELIERALNIQPNNPAYLDSFGWVYYRLGDYEAALKYLEAAAELDSDPVIYDHFGDALEATGKTAQAREWWQRALDQQPENEAIREKLNR